MSIDEYLELEQLMDALDVRDMDVNRYDLDDETLEGEW